MHKIHKLIATNGVAIIRVPNDFSIIQNEALSAGLINQPFWVAVPDHLSYFDHHSLASIAENTGWTVFDMLGDFPVDWFLFNEKANYIMDPSLGKSAYKAKILLTNLLAKNKIKDVLKFKRALVKIGSGRNLTMLIKSSNSENNE